MALILAVKKCCTRLTRDMGRWLSIKNSQRRVSYAVHPHVYDCLVIGAGGAGLRAAIGMGQEQFSRVVVSSIYPNRSRRNTAQADINAVIGHAANHRSRIPINTFGVLPCKSPHHWPPAADERKE